MESQYFIIKNEDGKYVVTSSNSNSLEKQCLLGCSEDDPCKNCDKCNTLVLPKPVVPTSVPTPVPTPPTQKNVNSPFTDPKTGRLSPVTIACIVIVVLLFLVFIYFKFFGSHQEELQTDVSNATNDLLSGFAQLQL